MLIFLIALAALGGAVFFVMELLSEPARERAGLFERAANYGREREKVYVHRVGGVGERVFGPLMGRVATLVLRLNPQTTLGSVSYRLVSAGLGKSVTPTAFLAAKGVFTIGGFVMGLLIGSAMKGPLLAVVFGLAFAVLGFKGPEFVVSSRIKSRQEAIKRQLPDALDLLAVSVEAGLGFDGAIAKLTEAMGGPLIDEFSLTLNEIRVGEGRQEALRKFAERSNVTEINAFTRSIIQADQFGISLGRILRVQAVDTRERRQLAAEEKAMKAPIKMLFPTVFFIFPAMFIVTLGPAFLNLKSVL